MVQHFWNFCQHLVSVQNMLVKQAGQLKLSNAETCGIKKPCCDLVCPVIAQKKSGTLTQRFSWKFIVVILSCSLKSVDTMACEAVLLTRKYGVNKHWIP